MLKSHGAPGGSDRRHDAVYLAQDGFVQRVEETDSGAIRSVREGRADTQAFFGQLAEAMPAWRQKRTNGAGQTDSAPPPLTEYLPAELTIWVDTPGKPLFYGKEALDKSGGAFPESVRSICEQAERICNSATVVSLSPAQCYIRAFRLDEQTAKEFSSARLFRTPSLPELQASAELGRALDTPYRLLPVPRDCNPYRAFRSRFEPMGDAAEFLVNGKPYQVRTYCAKAE